MRNDPDKHDITLNIHYSIPDKLWKKVQDVFRSMPYWCGDDKDRAQCLNWYDEDECVELFCSVEPGGLQIHGFMPEELWETWFPELKAKLSAALGYEIGEPEDGFDFVDRDEKKPSPILEFIRRNFRW